MELYVLDPNLRREHVYDRYISLVWTERCRAFGDFQLIVPSDSKARSQLREGSRLALDASKRVMLIQNISDKNGLLTISGKSLESIFEERALIIGHPFDEPESTKYGFRHTTYATMFYMYELACEPSATNANISTQNTLPGVIKGGNGIGQDIPLDTTVKVWDEEPGMLYPALQRVATEGNLGFALTRNHTTNALYYNVFSGVDRTSAQNDFPPVVFSPDTDTLNDPSMLNSIENYRNVAHVISWYGAVSVGQPGVDPSTISGFNRRVIFIDLKGIERSFGESLMTPQQIMIKRGREALANHRKINAIDGTVPITKYQYDVHYGLNDRVEMRVNGVSQNMRVTEHVYTSDAQGDRSFPTLEVEV